LASWDVFHAESLELERGLSPDAVRAAMAAGALRDDDLVRPAGTTVAWSRLGDLPELTARAEVPAAVAPPREAPSRATPPSAPASAPERIRSSRAEAPPNRSPSSDFEIRADHPVQSAQPEAGAATSTEAPPPGPAWLELGGEPDDVTFPVIPGRPEDWLAGPPTPGPSGREPGHEPPEAPAWAWPDDDDDEEEPDVADFDEQIEILDDDADGLEILDEDGLAVPSPYSKESRGGSGVSGVGLPVVPSRDWNEDRAPVEDGEEDDFTLSRSGPMTVEELDLAPMVDVAFQLVLFFMVTATTVLYKTLEIPKPTTDQAPGAVAQGHSRSVEDLQKDYILVEIDSSGAIKVDREPVAANVDALAERLRTAREKTNRKVMLVSAAYATPHRNAVLAYDAANEIGMSIALARPTSPQGPAPSVFPGPGRGAAPGPAAVVPTSAPPAASSTPAPAAPPPAAAAPAAPAAGTPPPGGVPF
jgi:biopolymer transport protein ExbD